jgi:hypothetical protein
MSEVCGSQKITLSGVIASQTQELESLSKSVYGLLDQISLITIQELQPSTTGGGLATVPEKACAPMSELTTRAIDVGVQIRNLRNVIDRASLRINL